ncbi:MAG: hypothetical protein ACI4DO_08555 [Roseburia sp.]
MMNPASIMKLMNAKNKFTNAHPKVVSFFQRAMAGGVPEGTVIELTMTRPGEEPITTNMRVQQSDLELIEELKNMAQ